MFDDMKFRYQLCSGESLVEVRAEDHSQNETSSISSSRTLHTTRELSYSHMAILDAFDPAKAFHDRQKRGLRTADPM